MRMHDQICVLNKRRERHGDYLLRARSCPCANHLTSCDHDWMKYTVVPRNDFLGMLFGEHRTAITIPQQVFVESSEEVDMWQSTHVEIDGIT